MLSPKKSRRQIPPVKNHIRRLERKERISLNVERKSFREEKQETVSTLRARRQEEKILYGDAAGGKKTWEKKGI